MNQISRELGLFQQDVRQLTTKQVKKIQALSFIVAQLKRFNREELKIFYEFCNGIIKERESTNTLDLSTVVIDENPSDDGIIEISAELHRIFKED
jgi:hypothetical protein